MLENFRCVRGRKRAGANPRGKRGTRPEVCEQRPSLSRAEPVGGPEPGIPSGPGRFPSGRGLIFVRGLPPVQSADGKAQPPEAPEAEAPQEATQHGTQRARAGSLVDYPQRGGGGRGRDDCERRPRRRRRGIAAAGGGGGGLGRGRRGARRRRRAEERRRCCAVGRLSLRRDCEVRARRRGRRRAARGQGGGPDQRCCARRHLWIVI